MIERDVAPSKLALGHPRVAFTSFDSADDPMLQAWVRFRAPLIGEPPSTRSRGLSRESSTESARHSGPRRAGDTPFAAVEGADHRFGLWRLLAVNNRELGRSYLLYDSFELARSHVHHLQRRPDALAVVIVTVPRKTSRGWIITFDGSPVMTCGRWYDSISTGVAAADGALAALSIATLSATPDHSRASGSTRRRKPAGDDSRTW